MERCISGAHAGRASSEGGPMSAEDTSRRRAREHGTRWQLSPLFQTGGRERAQTGYKLEWLARHGRGGPWH